MENEVFWLYLFTRLDAINAILINMSILGGFGVGAGWFAVFVDRWKGPVKSMTAVWACAVVLAVMTPTQKDAMFILAGTGVIQAAKTDTAQRLAGKSVAVIEKALDDYLKQTTKEKSK